MSDKLSEKEKKIIGERLRYLDQLFTNAIRETGYTEATEAYLTDILGQMIALANEIGINVVTTDDLKNAWDSYGSDRIYLCYHELRMELYRLRAKLITACVKAGVIENLKEIPIGVMEHEANSKQADNESLYF
jgi:hypothetical protein